jgi:glycosyltransferase involved in cell wall biosynthesis
MRENLQRKGLAHSKIFVLHNFPDNDHFPAQKVSTNWPRSRDGLTLIYCGTIAEQYRMDVVIRAFHQASKSIPELKFKIYGRGDKVSYIKCLAYALGIESGIQFFKPVPVEELRYKMQEADVGISCHRGGTFGNLVLPEKIFDYITQGLPVISCRTDTIREYVPDNAIFYFEPENFEDMAEKIIKMWNNPSLVRKRIKNARELTAQYNWQIEKDRLVNFYQQLIG